MKLLKSSALCLLLIAIPIVLQGMHGVDHLTSYNARQEQNKNINRKRMGKLFFACSTICLTIEMTRIYEKFYTCDDTHCDLFDLQSFGYTMGSVFFGCEALEETFYKDGIGGYTRIMNYIRSKMS